MSASLALVDRERQIRPMLKSVNVYDRAVLEKMDQLVLGNCERHIQLLYRASR